MSAIRQEELVPSFSWHVNSWGLLCYDSRCHIWCVCVSLRGRAFDESCHIWEGIQLSHSSHVWTASCRHLAVTPGYLEPTSPLEARHWLHVHPHYHICSVCVGVYVRSCVLLSVCVTLRVHVCPQGWGSSLHTFQLKTHPERHTRHCSHAGYMGQRLCFRGKIFEAQAFVMKQILMQEK